MEYAEDLQMDSQESAKRMEEGRLYLPSDPEIMKKQFDCLEKLYDYNQTRPHDQELRARMLKDMFAELGEGCYIDSASFQLGWISYPFWRSCLRQLQSDSC